MARVAKPTTSIKSVASKRKPGRPRIEIAEPAKAIRATKVIPTAPKRASVAVAPIAKLSKDELRSQVEKLERSQARLRAKNREAGQMAKAAAARITELEQHVARLEAKAASAPATAKRDRKPAPAVRAKRQGRKVDPGDAVPPGVAVVEPAPRDAKAKAAREKLEQLADE